MSTYPKIYTILGYDFSPWYNKMYTKEWAENPKNEKWMDKWRPGEVQLFTDLSRGSHLYFGYILATGDGYDWTDQKCTLGKIVTLSEVVNRNLLDSELQLPEYNMPPISIITFVEWV